MHTDSELLNLITEKSPHLSWIKDRTIFLSLHGSRAFNTHTENSDWDYKGICIAPKKYLYGFGQGFEQAELKNPNPDTTIYSIDKFFGLAAECNPNCLEFLFTNPEHHLRVTPLGEILLANKEKFLSKRIRYRACGYAYAQLNRLKMHRRWLTHPQKEPPTRESLGLPAKPSISKEHFEAVSAIVKKELDKYNFDFLQDCPQATKIAIRNAWQEMVTELKITTESQWLSAARTIGLSDNFIEIIQQERQYLNAKENYKKYLNWKATRNPKRYALEEKYGFDLKFTYQLVRILRMCRETLLTGKVNVRREDREELLSIRNGAWTFEQVIDFADKEEKELQIIYDTVNVLPRTPDYHALNELHISLVEKSLE